MTIAAIGTAIGVGASLFQGVQGYTAGQYRARVADMNRKIAEENANRSINRSQIEAQEQDVMTLAMLGEQTAAQASSGISLGSRSFGQVRQNARLLGRLDALNVRQAGEVEAYNYRTDAENFRAEAGAARMDATSSLIGGFLNAGSSLIGGAGKTGSKSLFGRRRINVRGGRGGGGSYGRIGR